VCNSGNSLFKKRKGGLHPSGFIRHDSNSPPNLDTKFKMLKLMYKLFTGSIWRPEAEARSEFPCYLHSFRKEKILGAARRGSKLVRRSARLLGEAALHNYRARAAQKLLASQLVNNLINF
jgi:hypothetical protein